MRLRLARLPRSLWGVYIRRSGKKFLSLPMLFHGPVNCGGITRFDCFKKTFVHLQELTRSFRKELSQNGSVSLDRGIVEHISHQKEHFVLGCQGGVSSEFYSDRMVR